MEINGVELKPNSHAYRNAQKEESERRRVQKVVTGGVKTKKKNGISKIFNGFATDDIKNDVIIPSLKKAASTIVKEGIDILLGTYSRGGRSSDSKVSYRSYYDKKDDFRRPISETRSRSRFDYDDIILESRGEAELVLDQLSDMISRYGYASVMDLYELVDIRAPYTSDNYGWRNISSAYVRPVSEGHLLVLPKAVPLD